MPDYIGRTSAVAPGYRYDKPERPVRPDAWPAVRPVDDHSRWTPRRGLLLRQAGRKRDDLSQPQPQVARRGQRGRGVGPPLYGKEIPIFERFRIGGDRSVRAFEYGSIYPLDGNDQAYFNEQGALLGGDKYLVLNLEAVYYVAGPLKVVFFFDAGNAWLEGQSVNPLKMRMSTGAELRMFLPIFQAPLRFIYGINLDPKVIKGQSGVPLIVEKRSDFQFSIGTTF